MRLCVSAFLAVAILAFLVTAPAQTESTLSPAVKSVLSHMVANRRGLNSFSVPIHFDIELRKVITIPLQLDGVRYYERPDREALIMNTVPDLAQPFQKVFGGLGSAQTWPDQYDISIVTLAPPESLRMYELRGVPKAGGNVDHILLDVSKTTYEPLKARWFYKNGATIVMDVRNAAAGKYLLPKTEVLDISFPSYKASATASYGTYEINKPIPDSVWQPVPSPTPSSAQS